MTSGYVTLIKCADPGEAAFYADFLAEHGIPTINTSDNLKFRAARYYCVNMHPEIRVHAHQVQDALALLRELPEANVDEMERLAELEAESWTENTPLQQCPLCGSEEIEAKVSGKLAGWLLWLFTLGIYKTEGQPLWICRDCDWDSRRK
ncbi:MAG: hypothetical protein GX130_12100 [Candidatus Hydrogenedens sp.]|nr:hypothetical protein [Candidatus Hydrogenedens sp.]